MSNSRINVEETTSILDARSWGLSLQKKERETGESSNVETISGRSSILLADKSIEAKCFKLDLSP